MTGTRKVHSGGPLTRLIPYRDTNSIAVHEITSISFEAQTTLEQHRHDRVTTTCTVSPPLPLSTFHRLAAPVSRRNCRSLKKLERQQLRRFFESGLPHPIGVQMPSPPARTKPAADHLCIADRIPLRFPQLSGPAHPAHTGVDSPIPVSPRTYSGHRRRHLNPPAPHTTTKGRVITSGQRHKTNTPHTPHTPHTPRTPSAQREREARRSRYARAAINPTITTTSAHGSHVGTDRSVNTTHARAIAHRPRRLPHRPLSGVS